MKTLEQIKNEVCIKNNFVGWNEFIYTCQDVSIKNRIIDEVMILAQKECLKLASENATYILDANDNVIIIKSTITNENNIIK